MKKQLICNEYFFLIFWSFIRNEENEKKPLLSISVSKKTVQSNNKIHALCTNVRLIMLSVKTKCLTKTVLLELYSRDLNRPLYLHKKHE